MSLDFLVFFYSFHHYSRLGRLNAGRLSIDLWSTATIRYLEITARSSWGQRIRIDLNNDVGGEGCGGSYSWEARFYIIE